MKIGSSTLKLSLKAPFNTKQLQHAQIGDVIIAEVLSENPAYPYLEQPNGELTKLSVGDNIVGVIGSRQALRGYVGCAPTKLVENGNLSLLNMGGVIGNYIDSTTELGKPIHLRYLGTVVDSDGVVNLKRVVLPEAFAIDGKRPIILVVGTCMNVGKTLTAAKLIEIAAQEGYRVGAAKLSGVAAVKDLRRFMLAGAVDVKSFLDCGLPSTVDAENLAPIVKTVINALLGDLLIVELGDGIMGHYKVETVLKDPSVMSHITAIVVCAGDLMAAYGTKLYFDQLGMEINAFSGLATETVSGSKYIEERLHIPAINGLKQPWKLFEALPLAKEVAHG
ncbi:MAG: hypothetical protein AB1489_35215 [Acidobacteriota bacterium]